MTIDEKFQINSKISKLRDEWDYEVSPGGWWTFKHARDWHLDANWPTLLRELSSEEPLLDKDGRGWQVMLVDGYETPWCSDPAEAVCQAWLKWKKSTILKEKE